MVSKLKRPEPNTVVLYIGQSHDPPPILIYVHEVNEKEALFSRTPDGRKFEWYWKQYNNFIELSKIERIVWNVQ
jgi:hypothetical protein